MLVRRRTINFPLSEHEYENIFLERKDCYLLEKKEKKQAMKILAIIPARADSKGVSRRIADYIIALILQFYKTIMY